jgi:hypothetical protein
LKEACRPEALERPRNVQRWIAAQISSEGAPE